MIPPSSIAARRLRWSGISLDWLSFSYAALQHRSCKDNVEKFRMPLSILLVPTIDQMNRERVSIFTTPAGVKEHEY